MNKILTEKIKNTVELLREIYARVKHLHPFIAFSTGKDSLAMAALIYEAIAPEKIPCVYVHHNLEFANNLSYLLELENRGFWTELILNDPQPEAEINIFSVERFAQHKPITGQYEQSIVG